MGFIVILVGTSLAPTVADNVALAQTNTRTGGTNVTNITGAAFTIIGLTTLFYVLGVASAGISVAAQGLRASGLV